MGLISSPSAPRDLLATTAARWGIMLSPTQLDQFDRYADELRSWNERVNLTAITDKTAIVTRHFLDSLRCALSWGESPDRLVDLGAGAGFPGLPLKILRPQLQLTLVESVAKKTNFLRHIVALLGLDNVTIIAERAEVVGHMTNHREQYDIAVARAVAELRVLAEYSVPLCRLGGRFLAPKGAEVQSEVAAAQPAISILGGRLHAIEQVQLPDLEPRNLVIVDKISPTPPQYPRTAGIPTKRPL